ncbi:MAG: hypothetical protein OEY96_13515, partial [Gammaproteobacteria bacterium]|nr:hypothetical protein [Gammaproteobacteria bacterium]
DGRILDKMELSTDYSIGLASKKRYEIDDTCKKLVIVDNRSNMSVSARLLNKPVVAFQVIITPEGTLQMSALERKLELY